MRDELKQAIEAARKGDKIKVERFSDLARTLVEALEVVRQIHERGAVLVESTTGRRSDRDAVTMIHDNLRYLRKGTTKRKAKASGKMGGRPRKDREMSLVRAERIWRNVPKYRTDGLALEHMPGWDRSAALRAFGKSGRPTGRPREKK